VKFLAIAIVLLMVSFTAFAKPKHSSGKPKSEAAKPVQTEDIAGLLILTDELLPSELKNQAAETLLTELPAAEEIVDDLKPTGKIDERYLNAYFAERPKTFLTDPQNLLCSVDFEKHLHSLNLHASDSAIDIFVYIMGKDQLIPSEVRKEEMIERFFSEGRPVAMIYYYLGAPQRSTVYLSPAIAEKISSSEQQRTLESAMIQALAQTDPSIQLEKFLSQISIRAYWMERMLSGESVVNQRAEVLWRPMAAAPLGVKSKSAMLAKIREYAMRYVFPASVILGSLVVIFGIRYFLRRRASYVFPEFDVEPRLGGAHAAGVGAVISFSSAAVPPASQREQVPEYLRRA
jgi:hypothetical protein